ncbi:Peptidoglycan-N-acetylglucosamine deacetylase [Bacillus sp. THAF10]|uniref:polysaccharide deacetylase family protein n=1 Tax=Bacillus sp. THAF10 TaxID=2587848 RepID=UPI0012682355|nr:polysaccharide deacetylase family protein [Bacillus sp. THAF10]QFT88707.1 Peptidoglycan-N-acetylglucosamine deacetylase [Bacillus sp. THAF10]
MKKWILPTLLMLLLTACGDTPENDGKALEEKNASNEENHSNKDKNNGEVPASTNGETPDDTEETDEGQEEQEEPGKGEEDEEVASPDENTSVTPQYIVNPGNYSIEPIQDAISEVVLLTIDDAPDRYALEMAKTLQELNVKAIFFVNGHFIETEEEKAVLKKIYDMGFPIGNHTMSHKSLDNIPEDKQYEEIMELNERIEEITGEKPRFFRAPFGANTDYVRELVKEEGMILMNWTYGYDWEAEYREPEALKEIMINSDQLRNGANLLMHDREWTNEALPGIVKGLQEKGYQIVDPDLIGAEEEVTTSE